MNNLGKTICMVVAAVVFLTGAALGADSAFRAKLVENKGRYLVVRTQRGEERKVPLSKKLVVVSRRNTTTDVGKIMKNSMLLLSLEDGDVTTIVVEEVPR